MSPWVSSLGLSCGILWVGWKKGFQLIYHEIVGHLLFSWGWLQKIAKEERGKKSWSFLKQLIKTSIENNKNTEFPRGGLNNFDRNCILSYKLQNQYHASLFQNIFTNCFHCSFAQLSFLIKTPNPPSPCLKYFYVKNVNKTALWKRYNDDYL